MNNKNDKLEQAVKFTLMRLSAWRDTALSRARHLSDLEAAPFKNEADNYTDLILRLEGALSKDAKKVIAKYEEVYLDEYDREQA